MNCVYILACGDGSLYTGWTNQLAKRFQEHCAGKGAKYTRSRLPLSLAYQEECATPTDARKREAQIKKLTRKDKLLLIRRREELLALAKQKLIQLKQPVTEITLLREKAQIALFRVTDQTRHFVLKLFLSDFGRAEINFYTLLQTQGLRTVPLIKQDQEALLMEDLDHSEYYSLAGQADMQNSAVMHSLGQWYRRLHSIEPVYLKNADLSEEWQSLCRQKIEERDRVLQGNRQWEILVPLLGELLERIAELPLVLCYNDFYYVNMAVADKEAFMFDYGRMGLNYPGLDLANALWFSDEQARAAFRAGYGLVWPDQEVWTSLLLPLQDFLMSDRRDEILSADYAVKISEFLSKNNRQSD